MTGEDAAVTLGVLAVALGVMASELLSPDVSVAAAHGLDPRPFLLVATVAA